MDQREMEQMLLDHEKAIYGTDREVGILERIRALEVGKIISDAAWRTIRWGLPILMTAIGILVTVELATR